MAPAAVPFPSRANLRNERQSVAIIGGGYFGCCISLHLANCGLDVTLCEKRDALFEGSSGTYGIRLHAGPHYPRSPATRESSHLSLRKFEKTFPNLVAPLKASYYALGARDSEELAPRVSRQAFEAVCNECDGCEEVDPAEHAIENVLGMWRVHEPVVYQKRAKEFFIGAVNAHKNIQVKLGYDVQSVKSGVGTKHDCAWVDGVRYDWVVNCTYFTSFSTSVVAGAKVIFQPCLTLTYEDMEADANDKPFMFTVMDGWFPCLMPIISGSDDGADSRHVYMLYHAKYTLLGSYTKYEDCVKHMESVREEWVVNTVRPIMETSMERFMPNFTSRFRYTGYLLHTATKLRTKSEFRRSLVWSHGKVIHVFSGKIAESTLAAEHVEKTIFGDRVPSELSTLRDHAVGELSAIPNTEEGACDMGVHRW